MAKGALELAKAIVSVVDSIKPLIPIIGALAGLKLAAAIPKFASGFVRGVFNTENTPRRFARGGGVKSLLTPGELVFGPEAAQQAGLVGLHKFNDRGDASGLGIFGRSGVSIVPGSGNTDNFPITLPDGSFVVRKDSVAKAAIRRDFEDTQRFGSGGNVSRLGGGGRARRRLGPGGFIETTFDELLIQRKSENKAAKELRRLFTTPSDIENINRGLGGGGTFGPSTFREDLRTSGQDVSRPSQQRANAGRTAEALQRELEGMRLGTKKVSESLLQFNTSVKNGTTAEKAALQVRKEARSNIRGTFSSRRALGPGGAPGGPPGGGRIASARRGLNRAGGRIGRRLQGNLGLVAAGGAIAIGSRLQQSENRNVAGLGGALSGAGGGALAGSAFGPLGAVVGGVTGGLIGLTSALEEADRKVRDVKVAAALDDVAKSLRSFGLKQSGENFGKVLSDLDLASKVTQSQIDAEGQPPGFFGAIGEGITKTIPNAFTSLFGSNAAGSRASNDEIGLEVRALETASTVKPLADAILSSIDQGIGSGLDDIKLSDSAIRILGQTNRDAVKRGPNAVQRAGELLEQQRIKEAKTTRDLSIELAKVNREVNDLTSRFRDFASIAQNAASIGAVFNNQIASIAAAQQGQVANIEIDNPFENIRGASTAQIVTGAASIRANFADSPLAQQLTDTVQASKRVQDALPGILERAASVQVGSEGDADARRSFGEGVSALGDVPIEFRRNLETAFRDLVDKSQGNLANQIALDPDFAKDLPIDALQTSVQDASETIKVLNDIKNAFINGSNKAAAAEAQANKLRTDLLGTAISQDNNLRELGGDILSTQDRLAPVRGQISALTRGEASPFSIGANLESLEQQRTALVADLATTRVRNPSTGEVNRRLPQLIDQLKANTAATVDNKQALQILASDTTTLSAIQKELSDAQGRRGAQKSIQDLLIEANFDPTGKNAEQLLRSGVTAQALKTGDELQKGTSLTDIQQALQLLQLGVAQAAPEDRPALQQEIVDARQRLSGIGGPAGQALAGGLDFANTLQGRSDAEAESLRKLGLAQRDQREALFELSEQTRRASDAFQEAADARLGVQVDDLSRGVQETRKQVFSGPPQVGVGGVDANALSSINGFNTSVAQLGNAVSGLGNIAVAANQMSQASQQLANLNIPETISVEVAPVQVIVTINGAEVLANIEGPMGDLVSKKINTAINQHINVITGETNEGFFS